MGLGSTAASASTQGESCPGQTFHPTRCDDVSIVIPARDEAGSIEALLDSLLAQSCLADEIVVCDAGSRDATRDIVRAFASRGVRLVEGGAAYPGRARNLAVSAARNAWVAFIDCGCRADPHWIEELLREREAHPDCDVVYGDYEPFVGNEWEAAQALTLLSPRNRATGRRPPFIASALVRRDVLLAVGGFPEGLRAAEDLRLFEALASAGARIAHAPRARVRWTLAPSPVAIFRRLRLYSAHHVAAGLGRTWHHRVLLMDACALGLLLAGLKWPVAWGVLVAGAIARLARTILMRRESAPPEARHLTLGRWARAAALLAVADAACVLGYVDFLRGRIATSPQ